MAKISVRYFNLGEVFKSPIITMYRDDLARDAACQPIHGIFPSAYAFGDSVDYSVIQRIFKQTSTCVFL